MRILAWILILVGTPVVLNKVISSLCVCGMHAGKEAVGFGNRFGGGQ